MKPPKYQLIFNYLIFIAVFFSSSAAFSQPKPEPGFSGFIQLTYGPLSYKSNYVAGILRNDVTPSIITSYDEVSSQFNMMLLAGFDIKYMMKNRKVEWFFGSALQDIMRFDVVQQFAIRYYLQNNSYLSIGALMSTAPANLWKDPYLLNEEREHTLRRSPGVRFSWSQVGQTHFGFSYDLRFIDIDEESGLNTD